MFLSCKPSRGHLLEGARNPAPAFSPESQGPSAARQDPASPAGIAHPFLVMGPKHPMLLSHVPP